MPPASRTLEDDPCPVPENTLGQIYRASPQGLPELIASIPPAIRGMLAVYCYRRAHLASISLAIAATCEEDDLTRHGGNAGAALFQKSREMAKPVAPDPQSGGRRKISLASGTLRTMAPLDDEMDDDETDDEPLATAALDDEPAASAEAITAQPVAVVSADDAPPEPALTA